MRVLAVTNMWPTPSEPWAGIFVRDQVEDLQRLGVDMAVEAFDGRFDKREYARAIGRVRRRLKSDQFDVVHAHYGLTGAVAACQRRVPVVTTFTGSDVGYSRWQRAVSWCVARVTTPVFVTSLGAGRVGLRGADVVAAGVDVEHFAPVDRGEARVKLGLDPRIRTVLLPASRSRPVKRADLFDLVIERVRAAGVEVQAMSLENLDRASVAVHMNAADVVLLTSDSEGSPVVVKEALACGTPVVSVPVGDVADVVGGLPGCAVAPRDPDLLAEAIRAALTIQEEDRIRLRARGELYGRRRAAERMLEIFERVAGQ